MPPYTRTSLAAKVLNSLQARQPQWVSVHQPARIHNLDLSSSPVALHLSEATGCSVETAQKWTLVQLLLVLVLLLLLLLSVLHVQLCVSMAVVWKATDACRC